MAVYGTQDQLENAIGAQTLLAIADRDRDGIVDDDVVTAALKAASELADSFLDDYLPVAGIPMPLNRAVLMIANEFCRLAEQSTEDSRLNYDRAISWLQKVKDGKAVLPGQPNVDDNTDDPGDPLVLSGERAWDRRAALRLF